MNSEFQKEQLLQIMLDICKKAEQSTNLSAKDVVEDIALRLKEVQSA
ncbi:hypothetical protein LCL95_09705 [Bacillus timonensis]|nr:hypothetical protein [Bacillus timonensis]